jgi:cytochrome P450
VGVVARQPDRRPLGIHKCIGMTFANLELRVILEELLARTSRIRLAGPVVRTSWPRRGVSSLPLELVGARPAA